MKNTGVRFVAFLMTAVIAVSNHYALVAADGVKVGEGGTPEIPAAVLSRDFETWLPPMMVPTVDCGSDDLIKTENLKICINQEKMALVPKTVRAFLIAHEYGHIFTQAKDDEAADVFAARVYSRRDMKVVRAAVWYFANIVLESENTEASDGLSRARRIGTAAGLSASQIEAIMSGDV